MKKQLLLVLALLFTTPRTTISGSFDKGVGFEHNILGNQLLENHCAKHRSTLAMFNAMGLDVQTFEIIKKQCRSSDDQILKEHFTVEQQRGKKIEYEVFKHPILEAFNPQEHNIQTTIENITSEQKNDAVYSLCRQYLYDFMGFPDVEEEHEKCQDMGREENIKVFKALFEGTQLEHQYESIKKDPQKVVESYTKEELKTILVQFCDNVIENKKAACTLKKQLLLEHLLKEKHSENTKKEE